MRKKNGGIVTLPALWEAGFDVDEALSLAAVCANLNGPVADAPQPLAVGEEAEVCLAAFKDGDRVWGIPWDLETQGALATFWQDNPSASELVCTVLIGTSEGTGSLTVRVGGVEEVIDVVVVP